MFTFVPLTDRVEKMRVRYRQTPREICTSRYRLITEFYMNHPEITGIMRRALNFKNICENIALRIDEDAIIVGAQSATYGAAALYPENNIDWLKEEAKTGLINTRPLDPYILSPEDRDYILKTIDFWHTQCPGNMNEAYASEGYFPYASNGLSNFGKFDRVSGPVGHFCANYRKVVNPGIAAIRDEAAAKMKEMEDKGVRGDGAQTYHFYHAVNIVCSAMLTLTKRYARLAEELCERESRPGRKKELSMMADTLNWIMEKPARNFMDALQAIYMYQTCMCLDGNMHGISWGRVDQYLGAYYEQDIARGTITPEFAQELLDLFYLKVAEMNKPWSAIMTGTNPGYTSGQLMTLGGVDKDGNDATNPVTYMMLQSMGRLFLHDPPQAMRIHKGTPMELWEAAVATTKRCGGVPSFENDDVIIPTLMKNRGFTLEDARDYCLIGCVEPGGCGNDWPCCGGPAGETYWNLCAGLWLAMNNGISTTSMSWWDPGDLESSLKTGLANQVGVPCGYLYEMETFEQVLDAFAAQIKFFAKWHMTNSNLFEPIMQQQLPVPVVSATMDSCMAKGRDVMFGGAKYQSVGVSSVGIGNCADSLQMIKHLCFDKKVCTTRELYDALMADWAGYEDLHSYILNEAPHYGNGDPEVDKWVGWVSDTFADAINALEGPYCHYNAGTFPVTTNMIYGKFTPATPDGRKKGTPLSDGISPVQSMDKSGPTALLSAISHLDCSKYANGTLLNMKFTPMALQGKDGIQKLVALLGTYFFKLGGMEVQINIVSADTLRDAKKNPENYQNLVVRVAGFSTYFVMLEEASMDDLISRTELSV
jgi:pyruvate formate-lyase/glycerol dehydratase family glycyl radical enzyme